MPVEILLSHSAKDKRAAAELAKHLGPLERSGKIVFWHRGLCPAGEDPDAEWRLRSKSAAIILLMVSADLEKDKSDDVDVALRLRQQGARVVPVRWRQIDFTDVPYKDLRMLPESKAITDYADPDKAWVEVVQGVRSIAEMILAAGGASVAPPPAARAARIAKPSSAAPSKQPSPDLKSTVLFLGANPADTTRLRLGEERREIDQRIQLGEHRDRFELKDAWAVKSADLIQTLLRFKPTIVHFSGHGGAQGQLYLDDEAGRSAPVSGESLAELFRIFKAKGLRCVVLNACYSAPQAEAIAQHIDCVIGISDAIPNPSAIAFASGFYAGLAAGESLQLAFELGSVQLGLQNRPTAALKIYPGPGVKLAELKLF